MILLTRLPEPLRLTENKENWLARFLEQRAENPGFRPSSKQYGHQEIRTTLRAMSFHKCFYCERELSETEDEVEHYIEVTEKPELAFTWENLYLSCSKCNLGKLPNTTISVSDCLDPCDPSEDPVDHLTFDDEYIRSRASSPKGIRTIQKYKLDRDELNYLRVKQLQQFERFLRKLHERRNLEGGRPLTQQEKEMIASFKQPEHAFSLMFSVYLTNLDL